MSSFFTRERRRGGPKAASVVPTSSPLVPPRFFPTPYTAPTCTDTAVIIPFFNPAHSVRILQNLLVVKHLHACAGIPTYFVECAFDDTPFLLDGGGETVFQYRSDSYMFYKENLIMLAEARLPPQYTKIVILDADVVFADPAWLARISAALDVHDVLQPYKEAVYLGFDFATKAKKLSCITDPKSGHTGFVWAFQRTWLHANPLCEYAVMGAGDAMLAHTIGVRLEIHAVYKGLATKAVVKTGFIDMTIFHLPHGSRETRQYSTRMDDLAAALRFFGKSNLVDLLERRDDGLLEWREAFKEKLNAIVRKYFERRRDDSVI
jgi:hypothetical protein